MWTYDDAPSSGVGVPDMDMRACPSYEAGFDACDPLGSVFEWSGRGPARVLRRRCRSEGVDRSPYEEMPMHRSADNTTRTHRLLPNKSQFTLNTAIQAHFGRPGHEISARVAENGDYIMTHEHSRHGYPQVRSKLKKTSPTRINNILSHAAHPKMEEDRHLPKVEELLEKYDHDMMEVPVTKQPLKSILNNPLLKSPPQGILKKPKTKAYQDPKSVQEGRRRQRASSESDNLFCGFNGSNSVYSYESRFSQNMNNLNNMKRAKDNSGTGYSYGTAIATLSSSVPKANVYMPKVIRSHAYKDLVAHKDEVPQIPPVPHDVLHMSHQPVIQVLRTTAIHNERHVVPAVEVYKHNQPIFVPTAKAVSVILPRQEPVSLCPKGSPELQVSSTALQLPAAKKPPKPIKKKVKVKPKVQMKTKVEPSAEVERPVSPRRPPEPLALDPWKMDTDVLLNEIHKLERIVDKRRNSAKSPTSPKSPGTKKDKDKEKDKDKKKEKDKEADKEKEKDDQNDTSINKLSNKLNGAVVSNKQTKESVLNLPDHIVNCLRLSLFPRVPPYLKFVAHDENPTLKVPMAIQKHLKWKLTTITPIVVKRTITNSGFRLVKSECDTAECPQEETVEWIGIWGKHMKSLMFRAIKDGQKMNHFPGTFQIGRKDRLWRNLQKLASKFGLKEFGIMPKSYVLPHDLKLLKRDWERYSENNEKWIIKPPASARGTGIKVVSRWTQIPKKRPVVVQRYICKPYLINGSKFDMRLYVLVTSVHPLRIYLYKDGLARFASVKYTNEITSLNDRYMHLTNYSINRLSKNYTPNEDFSACEGHKWTLQTLFQYLKTEKNVDTRTLWESLKDLVIKTIISGEASISSLTKANVTSRYNCYELFGVDVLLDEDLKPWLLEVNISPSLHSASPLDIHVKGPLVTTVLNIAQFQVPIKTNLDILAREKPHKLGGLPYDSRLYTVYLSKEERDKHIIYTNMEERDIYLRDILSTLTPDDVRHLIQAEDEYTQIGDMERIFPTKETHKYLGYLTGPRYYNRLFDAWETRYAMNREPGIDLLRNLCDIGYHLEVPPVPLKLSAMDRCRMMWTRRHRLSRSGPPTPPSLRWSHRPRQGPRTYRARAAPARRWRPHSGTPRPRARPATAPASTASAPADTSTSSPPSPPNTAPSADDTSNDTSQASGTSRPY